MVQSDNIKKRGKRNYEKTKENYEFILICIVAIMSLPSISSAASIEQSLPNAESGWTRYKYDSKEITYYGGTWKYDSTWTLAYNSPYQLNGTGFKFNFVGTKFRLISALYHSSSKAITVKIDGVAVDIFSTYPEPASANDRSAPLLSYEKTGLENKEHYVEFINNTDQYLLSIQAIDIDEGGILKPYSKQIDVEESNLLKFVAEVGETIQLSVNDNLDKNTEMKWTSSAPSITTIDNQGKVTGVKPGNAAITVKNADGTYTDTINILVIESEPQLAVDINVGDSRRMTIDDLVGTTNATWTSNDETIATVDNKGKVTAVAVGTTYMTVKDDKGNEVGKIYVRVRN